MVSLNHHLLILVLCCLWILFATSFVFTPITLDLLLPLNESRRRYFSYFTMFSHDRIEYLDIACVNILVVHTIGMLSLAGTELMLVLFAHYMCGLFDITRYEWICWLFSFSHSQYVATDNLQHLQRYNGRDCQVNIRYPKHLNNAISGGICFRTDD